MEDCNRSGTEEGNGLVDPGCCRHHTITKLIQQGRVIVWQCLLCHEIIEDHR